MAVITTAEQGIIVDMTTDGLGLTDSGIALPYCLPAEKVAYEKVARRRSKSYYFRGVIEQNPSLRRDPVCVHFGKCGGCTLQHLQQDFYKEYKKSLVIRALISNNIDCNMVEDPVIIPPGHRRRTNMDIRKKNGIVFLGYHELKSFYVTNIGPCHILENRIERLLDPLGALMNEIMEDLQKAKIFLVLSEVGIDIALEIQEVSSLSEPQRAKLIEFAKNYELCRLRFRHRKFIDTLHCQQNPYVLIDSIAVSVDPWCFLQSSVPAENTLIDWAMSALSSTDNTIADLFCGRGTLTIPLSKKATIYGYEYDENALLALRQANDQAKRPIAVERRDLFTNPLSTEELKNFDALVINPPRAGARNQAIEISRSDVPKVIYVSCNPNTFAADAALLIAGGYRLAQVKPLDQFVYTPHMEVFAVFVK